MPYKISKRGSKYCVVKGGKGKSSGKFKAGHVFGRHSSKKKAQKQLAAIKANESFISKLNNALMEAGERPPEVKILAIMRDPDRIWISINGERYGYETSPFIIDKFRRELRHTPGKALVALKKASKLIK